MKVMNLLSNQTLEDGTTRIRKRRPQTVGMSQK
jgi:hypothetical protein